MWQKYPYISTCTEFEYIQQQQQQQHQHQHQQLLSPVFLLSQQISDLQSLPGLWLRAAPWRLVRIAAAAPRRIRGG
jgi:hypothetical protein